MKKLSMCVPFVLLLGCDQPAAPATEPLAEAEDELVSGHDLTCGAGARRVRPVEGAFPQPESCTFHPGVQNPNGEPPGRFYCSVNAYISGAQTSVHDGVGWVAQFTRDGRAFHPLGLPGPGGGFEAGFGADIGWATQCGAGILGSPLGLTVNPAAPDVDPSSPDDGKLYVIEGGKLDADGDPATAETQAISVFTLKDGTCFFEHHIPLPTATGNDVAFSGSALYVTDSNFADPANGRIYKVLQPDFPGALASLWKTVPGAPNPIVAHTFKGPGDAAAVPYLFVATLGTVLDPSAPNHNGQLLRIRISDRAMTAYAGIAGEYDGLAWAPGIPSPSLLLSDLSTQDIVRVNPTTGAVTPWVDLSPYLRQLGGLATDGGVPTRAAVTDFRNSIVMVE